MEKVRCYSRRKRGKAGIAFASHPSGSPLQAPDFLNGQVQPQMQEEHVVGEEQEQEDVQEQEHVVADEQAQQHVQEQEQPQQHVQEQEQPQQQPQEQKPDLEQQQELPTVEAVKGRKPAVDVGSSDAAQLPDFCENMEVRTLLGKVGWNVVQNKVVKPEEVSPTVVPVLEPTEQPQKEASQMHELEAAPASVLRLCLLESHEYQERILNDADAIWQKFEALESSKRLPARGREPPRSKAHWDFVLEEMAWLAKDFERERKWKLAQAKKVALKLSKSKVDCEAKGVKRLKEERQRLRRVASGIAKDVKKFWVKIEKLVLYKHQLEVEERKKRALDRHLDFLLGQTERYSTMLAENLADPCLISAPKSPLLTSAAAFASNAGLETGLLLPIGGRQTGAREEVLPTSCADSSSLDGLDVSAPVQHIVEHNNVEPHSDRDHCLEPELEICPKGVYHSYVSVNGETPSEHKLADKMLCRKDCIKQTGECQSLPGTYEENLELRTVKAYEYVQGEDTALFVCHDDGRRVQYNAVKEQSENNTLVSEDLNVADGPEMQGQGMELECLATLSLFAKESSTSVESPCTQSTSKVEAAPGAGESKHGDADEKSGQDILVDAAAAAQSAQPTGYTFSTTKVRTVAPFLLKHSLREYQHIGLDWLVTMYEKRLNGILADEMGLGKTIMTISLLALLACEKGIWGPHLIVVPTSVMINWETEFMKWCPAFKIMTYFGNARERKFKRQGWSKPNSFHICITTYRLVIQDAKAFKRKKWKYLILDEAHLIKNWRSQRWQTLLNFNSKRRILLTGTPLQNDLMELWSLMHFLMPHVFQSHQQFRDWFSNPITGMVEGQEQVNKELVDRLHNVLRPFLLRRLKQDVEKQLPMKHEHVIFCRLSKRQRHLYEDFMASSETQATLASGNFLGIINVLMQLRKVCNHPDLFEGRAIISSCDLPGIDLNLSSKVCSALQIVPTCSGNCYDLSLLIGSVESVMSAWESQEIRSLATPASLIEEISSTGQDSWYHQETQKQDLLCGSFIEEIQNVFHDHRTQQRKEQALALAAVNVQRCSAMPVYGVSLRQMLALEHPVHHVHKIKGHASRYFQFSSRIADIVQLPLTRMDLLLRLLEAFIFAIPAARSLPRFGWFSQKASSLNLGVRESNEISQLLIPLRPVFVRRQLFFPDRRLLQFDCGKLQEMAFLLRRLKSEGHRALIFTQMTKMLDILESFINLYGYTYLRLDGSTKPEQRQILMQRFNTNPKIFLFILSTRSGGVGINLVGADTVIFYDSDWNPAMDLQAQDRCHRIGQTREVHIYRLVSESTVEENILKKANQKRILDDLVIQSGSYNTDFFKKLDPMELFSGLRNGIQVGDGLSKVGDEIKSYGSKELDVSNADVEAALRNAEDEADFMAMKRAEQEKDAENQEFTEEGFAGILEDEECLDENGGGKLPAEGLPLHLNDETDGTPASEFVKEVSDAEVTIVPGELDEDMDMLADVREMAAAAAAAGKGSMSFEDQLRPIERYAMQCLEVWDLVSRKPTQESQVQFEEKEWELDQLEKLKEEQEAEIDEDNGPLLYENWDTSFANEAYRQQVEVLAQQQENQRLEWEAIHEELQDADRAVEEAAATVIGAEIFKVNHKSKDMKLKRAKFKSLRHDGFSRDRLSADLSTSPHNARKVPIDGDARTDLLLVPSRSPSQRKRKAPKLLEEEILVELEQRKLWKESAVKDRNTGSIKLKKKVSRMSNERMLAELGDELLPSPVNSESMVLLGTSHHGANVISNKIKLGGMSIRKGPLVMLEKERKKDAVKSQDQVPVADSWMAAEDAVLCAVLHEYGGNWHLVSDALAGVPDGGVYRGRHRHPVHCRERFRQLLAQNSSANGDPSSAKISATNVQLKVTEEHTKRLLEGVQQLPDNEYLLQRHFSAALEALKFLQKAASHFTLNRNGGPLSPHFISVETLIQPQTSGSKAESLIRNSGLNQASLLSVAAQLEQALHTGSMVGDDGLDVVASTSIPDGEQIPMADDEEGGLDYLIGDLINGEEEEPGFILAPPLTVRSLGIEQSFGLKLVPSNSSSLDQIRPLSTELTEQRFRKATKISFDGDIMKWVSAAGTITGVVGLEIPTKRLAAKKRHCRDVNKPFKPKQPRAQSTTKKAAGKTSQQAETVVSSSSPYVAPGGVVNIQQSALDSRAACAEQEFAQEFPQTEIFSDCISNDDYGMALPPPTIKSSSRSGQHDEGNRLSGLSPRRACSSRLVEDRDDGHCSAAGVRMFSRSSPLHRAPRHGFATLTPNPQASNPQEAGFTSRTNMSAGSRGLEGLRTTSGSKQTSQSWASVQIGEDRPTSRQIAPDLYGSWPIRGVGSKPDYSPRVISGRSAGQCRFQELLHSNVQSQRDHVQNQAMVNSSRYEMKGDGCSVSRSPLQHPLFGQSITRPVWDNRRGQVGSCASSDSHLNFRPEIFQAQEHVMSEPSRGLLVEHYQITALESAGRLQPSLGAWASDGFPGYGRAHLFPPCGGYLSSKMTSFAETYGPQQPSPSTTSAYQLSPHSSPSGYAHMGVDTDLGGSSDSTLVTLACNSSFGSLQDDRTGAPNSPSL